MERRRLRKSGLGSSVIGPGLWAVGGTEWGKANDRESGRTIEAALAAGVNFFDTADVPGNDLSGELLGQAIRRGWDRFIVAGKIGWVGKVWPA